MPKRLTTDIFISKAKEIHGLKSYDYSLVKYLKNNIKIKIICKKHGIFEQTPNDHLSKRGCRLCSIEQQHDLQRKDLSSFINQAIKIHGNKYDYSLVDYINNHKKIKIICKEHGIFEQQPCHHLLGSCCSSCSNKKKLTTEEFIKKAKEIHGDRYNYSLVNYRGNKKKVNIICKLHGIFEQRPNDHLNNHGCYRCNLSKGEAAIIKFLIENNIDFIPQYKFAGCKNKRPLPFDFYLPKYNICIEFDGEQHFKVIRWNGISLKKAKDSFKLTKSNDFIKDKYCKDNMIDLIRISYINVENVNNIISKCINTKEEY